MKVKKEEEIAPEGSLKDIQDRIAKVNHQLQLVDPENAKEVEDLKQQLKELTDKEHQIKVSLGMVKVDPKAVEGSLKQVQDEISK